MFGNLTSNTRTSASDAFGQNTIVSRSTDTSAFGAPKPATGFDTSTFNEGRSASSGTAVAGPSGTNYSGSAAPSAMASAFSGVGRDANPPPMTTGTSTPAYSVFSEKDPSNPRTILGYQTITATPAYRSTSLEELRFQDYKQNRRTVHASDQTSFQNSVVSAGPFGTSAMHQQPTTGLITGNGGTAACGTIATQPTRDPFGAVRKQQLATGIFGGGSTWGQPQQQQQQQQQQPAAGTSTSTCGDESASRQLNPGTGFGSTFGQPTCPVSNLSKQDYMEEFLRKFLLGEELVNIQFHLFSVRSSPSGRITKPRIICGNNVLLAKSSDYFSDLLSSDINPSDPSLSELADGSDVPGSARIDDYGYGSDSDLDDCDDPIPEPLEGQSATLPSKIGIKTQPKDDELSDDGSESVSSDMFVTSPEEPRTDAKLPASKDGARSVASSETAVHRQETQGNRVSANRTVMHLRSLGGRHILVKDTAFQTWYTLLNYLSTGKVNFLPLSSAVPRGQSRSSTSSPHEPRCSAKSMYRLACKVGLDCLRDRALAHIRSSLTEHNILREISFNVVSRHPQLLEMELNVLYSHIASPPVVANFPAFLQRIANKELPHGDNIIIDIHMRFLKALHPFLLVPTVPLPSTPSSLSSVSAPLAPSIRIRVPTPVVRDLSDTIEASTAAHVDKPNDGFQCPEQQSEGATAPTANEPKRGRTRGRGKKKS